MTRCAGCATERDNYKIILSLISRFVKWCLKGDFLYTDTCQYIGLFTAPEGRSTPEGIAPGLHLQLPGFGEDERDRRRQVLTGHLRTRRRGIGGRRRCIPDPSAPGRGKTLVDGTHIREPAPGVDHRKGRTRLSPEKEQAGVLLIGVGLTPSKWRSIA